MRLPNNSRRQRIALVVLCVLVAVWLLTFFWGARSGKSTAANPVRSVPLRASALQEHSAPAHPARESSTNLQPLATESARASYVRYHAALRRLVDAGSYRIVSRKLLQGGKVIRTETTTFLRAADGNRLFRHEATEVDAESGQVVGHPTIELRNEAGRFLLPTERSSEDIAFLVTDEKFEAEMTHDSWASVPSVEEAGPAAISMFRTEYTQRGDKTYLSIEASVREGGRTAQILIDPVTGNLSGFGMLATPSARGTTSPIEVSIEPPISEGSFALPPSRQIVSVATRKEAALVIGTLLKQPRKTP